MIILNVRLKNFGPFRDLADFDLSVEKDRNIILVGGLNGSGKTSLLNGIRLALFGKLISRSLDSQDNYESILNQYLNQQLSENELAWVEMVFKQNVEDRFVYQIKRSWKKNNGTFKEDFNYKKVFIEDNDDRSEEDLIVEGLNWYGVLETLFPPQVARLFLFDGEKIETMADPINTGKMLGNAIDVLFGGGMLSQLEQDLKYVNRELIKEQAKYSGDRLFIEEVKKYSTLEESIENLKMKRSQLEDELQEIEEKKRLSQEELRSIGGDYYHKRKDYEKRIAEVEKSIEILNQNMITLMNQELPFLFLIGWIEEIYEKGKNSIFDQDILAVENLITERDSSIINNLLKEGYDNNLIQKIKLMMQGDKAQILGSNITQFSHQEQGEAKFILSKKDEVKHTLKSIFAQFSGLESELDLNKNLLAILPPVEKAQPILKVIEDLKKEALEIVLRIKMVDEQILELEKSKELKQKYIHNQVEKFSIERLGNEEISRMQKRINQVETLICIFKRRLSKERLKKVEQLALEAFNTIYRKVGLVRSLSISHDELSLEMEDYAGNTVELSRLSAGERQILVTSLLWAIAKASKNSLPFIIDTPLGRLDSKHRSNLVDNFYPIASHQVILLSTDQEIVGDNYENLRPYIAKEYGIVYDTRTRCSGIIKNYPFKER